MAWNVVNAPVPCISGDAGQVHGVSPASTTRSAIAPASSDRSGIASPNEGIERRAEDADEVLVAPHHALGHSGRAPGVEEVHLVAGALDPLHGLAGGEQRLELDGPVDER